MDYLLLLIGLAAGATIGFLVAKLQSKPSGELRSDHVDLHSENSSLTASLKASKEENQTLDIQLKEVRESLQREQKASTEWRTRHEALQAKLEEQKKELSELQEKFTKDFQLVANKILEEKSAKFTDQNKKNLDEILSPLKEKIADFQKKVEESNKDNNERSSAMREQLRMLRELNQEITQETRSLTQALRGDSKTQGNWGEFHLESILEKAGLQKNVHYSKETNLKSEDGSNQRLDYIINLPDGKHLILDSKVSLTAYSNFFDADTEESQTTYLKQHLDSIHGHIKLLGDKDYPKLHGIQSPDYVMMFVANEPALTLALKHDMALFEKALDRNIVLVSTSTLLATLRTISYIWKQDLQNKNAIEIARQAAALYDKFAGFSDDLIRLGNQLGTVEKTYQESMKKLSEGKDNLVRKTERLKDLGVNPSKQIDQRMLDRSEDEE